MVLNLQTNENAKLTFYAWPRPIGRVRVFNLIGHNNTSEKETIFKSK